MLCMTLCVSLSEILCVKLLEMLCEMMCLSPLHIFLNIENLFKGACNNYIDKVVDGWLVKCLHK